MDRRKLIEDELEELDKKLQIAKSNLDGDECSDIESRILDLNNELYEIDYLNGELN